MRSEGLSWGDVADKLEEELAKAEGRHHWMMIRSASIATSGSAVGHCTPRTGTSGSSSKSIRSTAPRARSVDDGAGSADPHFAHTEATVGAWLRRREMVLAAFLDDSEGAGHEEGTSDVRDVVGNST